MVNQSAERFLRLGSQVPTAKSACKQAIFQRQEEIIDEVITRLNFLGDLFSGYIGADQTFGNLMEFERWKCKPKSIRSALSVQDDYDRLVMINKIQTWLWYAERQVPTLLGAKNRYLDQFKSWYYPSEQKVVDPTDVGTENLGEFVVRWANDRRRGKG